MNKQRKKECQVIFMLLVTSLLLQEADKEAGESSSNNPAVSQCIAVIDMLLKKQDDHTRNMMVERIQSNRIRFTKNVENLTTSSSLIGALRLLTSDYIRTKPGTRLDFIIQTFKGNLKNMELLITFRESDAQEFQTKLKEAVQKVGGQYSKRK